jgi:hypothetical protein
MPSSTAPVLKRPGYAPIFLWFLNHDLEPAEIRRQVREFRDKGWGGFLMSWINGGEPYMGARWLDGLEVAIQAAAEHGIEAWLYDEAWCPSCFAGGRILCRRPDLQMHTLWHAQRDVTAPAEVVLEADMMKVLRAVAVPLQDGVPHLDQAVDLAAHVGSVVVDPMLPYRHTYGYYDHAKPLEHWRQDSRRRVWRLRWQPPGGTWRVYLFCARGRFSWDQVDMLDVLRPEAIAEFLGETHEVYARRFQRYFGTVIPGIMTDESKYLIMPWTERLPARFRERTGADLLALLPALADPAVPGSAWWRSAYHRLCSDLFRETYIEPMAAWCEAHGLLLTGHLSPEEDLSWETDYTGSLGRLLRSFHLPGTDIIIQAVGDAQRPCLNLGPRLASTVARQEGRERVFVEVGACCEEDISLEGLKYLCDWLMVNGINFFTLHGMSYSLAGYGKFLTGQTYGAQANLWENMGAFTEYLTSRCRLLTAFRPWREAAVLKPHTASRAATLAARETSAPREVIDAAFNDSLWAMLQAHIEVDLLDEDTAADWLCDAGVLHCGQAAYRLLLIPTCDWIAPEAAARLSAWAADGGHVLCVGHVPRVLGPEPRPWTAAVQCCATLVEAVAAATRRVPPPICLAGPQAHQVLTADLRNPQGEAVAFLLNLLDEPVEVELRSAAHTGHVSLAPHESRTLPWQAGDATCRRTEHAPAERLELAGPWRVKALQENHIPLLRPVTCVEILPGTAPLTLVVEAEEWQTVAASLAIDGKSLAGRELRPGTLYDPANRLLDLDGLLPPGLHHITLDTSSFPTVMLAGRWAVFATPDGWRIGPEPTTARTVDREATGYPFLRGRLRFVAEFALPVATGPATALELPGRRGCVNVRLDGRDSGVVAWQPDTLPLGAQASGPHRLELDLIGDGIGVLRTGPYRAGLEGPPAITW